ncbi:MAG: hypothetical protein AABY64_13590 [Bdellovibrionota bacterium]
MINLLIVTAWNTTKKNQPKISDIIALVSDSGPLEFESFTNLATAPDAEPWTSVKLLCKHKSKSVKAMGAISNGVLTNKKTVFLFSLTILEKILKKDPNFDEASISGQIYKKILAQLTDPKIGFMKCLTAPSTYNSNKHKAGTYEVIYPQILHYLNNS